MANHSSAASMICLTALALLLITSSFQAQGGSSSMNMKLGGGKQKQSGRPSSLSEYVPVRSVVYRSMALPATARTTEAEGYQPFELCEGCRCCSTSNASSSSCVETSCCYSIDCDIPGKPFGTCAFTPHTCGCGDTNCTQPS